MDKDKPSAEEKNTGLWKPVLLISLVVTVLTLAWVFDIAGKMGDLRQWLEGFGSLGPLVFILIYIVAVVASLPGSAITIAAGALFGSVVGVILVSIASTIGASLAFLIARYFARDAVARWVSTQEKFQKIDTLSEEHGAMIVAITRLVPILPFNLLNYAFGLTKVSFPTYVFWSWLCMLPGTVLYVVGADALTVGLSEGKVPWPLVGVIGAVVVILILLARFARKKLSEKEKSIVDGQKKEGLSNE